MANEYTNIEARAYDNPDYQMTGGPASNRRSDYVMPEMPEDQSDKYLSARPPEGYVPRQYDTKKFEKTVFEQLGGNPYDIDVVSRKANILKQSIPGLFRHVFRGKLKWSDRYKMNTKQARFWGDVLTKYDNDVEERVIRDRTVKIEKFKYMKGRFEDEKKEFESHLDKYRTRRDSLQKEYRGKKVWVHNKHDKIKRQVHPLEAEAILRNDKDWVLGQPYGTEGKPTKPEKFDVFNPSEHIKRKVTAEEAEDLLRITDDNLEPVWKMGVPYGREERGAKEPTPKEAIKRITALKKELSRLEQIDSEDLFMKAALKNKEDVQADLDHQKELYKQQLQDEIDWWGQYSQEEEEEEYDETKQTPVEKKVVEEKQDDLKKYGYKEPVEAGVKSKPTKKRYPVGTVIKNKNTGERLILGEDSQWHKMED